ncbi:MAG: D-allose ABC transporter permease [Candidatus Vecturithrix sp.]|jgi:D-allose transport system permease protein|nr:D-allose ABC transporter permease [Candidatus Vecturithrix sp.]
MTVSFRAFWQKYGILLILLLLVVIMGILSPKYFLTVNNLVQIILQSSITILIAVGEFFAILIAGIDLSVGSVLALTGMVTAKLLVNGVPILLAVLFGGVILGGALGSVNGFLVVQTGLHPFIITMGGLTIFRGLTLVISDARPVYGFPPAFQRTIAGSLCKIPIPILIALAVAVLFYIITTKTILGRNLYAIGGNQDSAWLSGINVKVHKIVVFVFSGVCSGVAGVVMIGRLGAAEPLAGQGFELYAIASAIIGGTSFFGGKGRISGVVIGAIIIGLINNSLNILNVPTFYQQIVMGSLIIGSVFLDKALSAK